MVRRVVIVILTYNSAAFIRPCLDALRAHTSPDAHVVVVDNASADGTLDIVRAEYPWAETIATGANLGVARGNNLVLAQYDADLAVMLNPDTEVHAGWLDALIAEVASDPRIGIVGGKLLYPDGRIQHAGGEARATGPGHIGVLASADAFSEPRDVDYVTFACALLTRSVFERIGYLDEGYTPYYYEDADLCLRARAAGFRVRYTPACIVTHHEGVATGRGMTPAKARIMERNRIRFKLLHDPVSRWARSSWQETKTLVGHTLRGRGSAILSAWADAFRDRKQIRARRRDLAAFVPSTFSPPDRHAPKKPV